MVEGGKASAGPQMGQSFGPLGVNIQEILSEINKKTADFKGMKVPVKVTVETSNKSFTIEVGTPPTSELIKKEVGVDKGSGEPNKNKIGNLAIEQVIKIAKMKQDSMIINNLKGAVKSVIGTCGSLGVLVENKIPNEINVEVDNGVYDKEINEGKTEPSSDKLSMLKAFLSGKKKEYEAELAAKKAEEEEKKEEKAEGGEEKKEEAPKEELKKEEEKK